MPNVFVYGPDTLQARIYDRVGPSQVIGGAVLDGWALEFNKPNMKNKDEGLANITERPKALVYGVVYELSLRQLETLEGYFGGYGRRDVTVTLLGESGEQRKVSTWTARRIKSGLRPSKSTLEMTARGAKENGAPDSFQGKLQELEVLP